MTTTTPLKDTVAIAAAWLEEADSILIAAGAGMSANAGYNVYVDEADFKKYYPDVPTNIGLTTAYQAIGLMPPAEQCGVPDTLRWGFFARHMRNMRWAFPPNDGYAVLKRIAERKTSDFVWTSNVDGMFVRSGFERVYTPQGDWSFYQCRRPCAPDSVFPSKDLIERLCAAVGKDGKIPASDVPKCPRCGSSVIGNVRVDGAFLHSAYDAAQDELRRWIADYIDATSPTTTSSVPSTTQADKPADASTDAVLSGERPKKQRVVTIVEIGSGHNTPIIVRQPMEALAAKYGDAVSTTTTSVDEKKDGRSAIVRLIRINPAADAATIPVDVTSGVSVLGGWELLRDIEGEMARQRADPSVAAAAAALATTHLERRAAQAATRGHSARPRATVTEILDFLRTRER